MIKIGLIDSGINVGYYISSNRIINVSSINNDYTDNLGHGTYCSYLISRLNPTAIIHNIKVFDKQLITSTKNIINGIRWCIDNNVKLINISVAIRSLENYYEMVEICNEAERKKVIIISSGNSYGSVCLPAYLNNVIGVGVARNINYDKFYFVKDSPIQYYTLGEFEDLPSNKDGLTSIHGISYATANMTGIISRFISNNQNELNYKSLVKYLNLYALELKRENIISIHNKFEFKKCIQPISINNQIIQHFNEVKKAYLISDNSITKSFYKKYRSLLKFDVVTDKYNTLDKILTSEKEDAIIFDDTNIKSIKLNINKKIFSKQKIKAVNRDKTISIDKVIYPSLNYNQSNTNLHKINKEHLYKNLIPVYSLINIGNYPSIFDLELELRERITNKGIQISHIGSYELSEFFGCSFSMPDFNLFQKMSFRSVTSFSRIFIETINNSMKSDAIMFGLNYNTISNRDKSSLYHILLNSIKPDVVLFVINDMDYYDSIVNNVESMLSHYSINNFFFIKNDINIDYINDTERYKLVKEGIDQYRKLFLDSVQKSLESKYNSKVFFRSDLQQNDSLVLRLIQDKNIN